jgi:uncharacterized membrane protein
MEAKATSLALLKKNKRGLAQWSGVAIGFGLLMIVAVIVIVVLSELQGTLTVDTAAYNATGDAITGATKLTDFAVLIGVVVAISIVVGVLFAGFGGLARRGGSL